MKLLIFLCITIASAHITKPSDKPYQFVHITKTGGTALDRHFAQYYSKYIETDHWLYRHDQFENKFRGHYRFWVEVGNWEEKCYYYPREHRTTTRKTTNPIVVLRDPFDRLLSCYMYWKHGSELHPSQAYQKWSLEYYLVNILHNKHADLKTEKIWEAHYKPMVDWIFPEDYAKTTVVMYNDDLNVVLKPLLNTLNIPFQNKSLTKINKSNKHCNITWTSTTKALVRKIYAEDFELLQTVQTHPEQFAAVIGTPVVQPPTTKKDVVLIYITHIDDEHQRKVVDELYKAFGSKLLVSWDNQKQPDCPFPNITCINVTLDKVRTYDWKTSGTGHEKALMWSMKNYHTFDRVWIMEEDVHYTNLTFLHQIVTFDYHADLILNYNYTVRPSFIKLSDVITKQWEHLQISNWSWAEHQFFGASQNMLKAMHQTYTDNNNTLLFLESMWATVANLHGLKIGGWFSYFEKFSKNFQYRPCHTKFPWPGLYHPAKHRNGSYINCSKPIRALQIRL